MSDKKTAEEYKAYVTDNKALINDPNNAVQYAIWICSSHSPFAFLLPFVFAV